MLFGFRLVVLRVGWKEVGEVYVEGWEIEGTRWFIGRCVVLCVHVGLFDDGG